jgi:phage tail-like protein
VRAALPGLATPYPIGAALPALYAEDDYVQRMTAALDEVLAPVFLTLDCLDGYLDPALAPEDVLDWLAGWVAVEPDERWTAAQRRAIVAAAVALHRRRGTLSGLARLLRTIADPDVEVLDSGGCTWSETPDGPLPGSAGAQVMVRVAWDGMDTEWLRALTLMAVPAHVRVTVTGPGDAGADAGQAP